MRRQWCPDYHDYQRKSITIIKGWWWLREDHDNDQGQIMMMIKGGEIKCSTLGAGTDHCWGSPEIPRELKDILKKREIYLNWDHIVFCHHDDDHQHHHDHHKNYDDDHQLPSWCQVVGFRGPLVVSQVIGLRPRVCWERCTPSNISLVDSDSNFLTLEANTVICQYHNQILLSSISWYF